MITREVMVATGILDSAEALSQHPASQTAKGKLVLELGAIKTGPLAHYEVSVDFVTSKDGVLRISHPLFGITPGDLYLRSETTVSEVIDAIDKHLVRCRDKARQDVEKANRSFADLNIERTRISRAKAGLAT